MPRLHQDFIQGVEIVRRTLIAAPDQFFLTMDTILLEHRLLRMNKHLAFSYQQLGERGLVYLMQESPAAGSEEIERIYHQIETIMEDEKRVLAEIEAVRMGVAILDLPQNEKLEVEVKPGIDQL